MGKNGEVVITDELLKITSHCSSLSCGSCKAEKECVGSSLLIDKLSKELLNERKQRADNPGVWDGAPEWATHILITAMDDKGRQDWANHFRTLPKTKAREIAESAVKDGTCFHAMINGVRAVDVIERAILEYEKQTKGE